MFKLVLIFASGAAVGYAVSRVAVPPIPAAQRAAGAQVPVSRMAGDMIYMCDTMRPALRQVQAGFEDGRMSIAEAAALYGQFERLT